MLKTRIIPTMLYKDFGLVKGKGFDKSRRTGSLMQAVKVYNLREVDELVYLDVEANKNQGPDYEVIKEMARECFCPLAVGGGISSVAEARNVLLAGADKIVLNTFAFKRLELIKECAALFGSQSVVVSVDVKDNKVVIFSGKEETGKEVKEWLKEAEESGAGEILLTSVEKDGFMEGYDLRLIEEAAKTVSIPIIASGGAGKLEDFALALKAGAHAVSCASLFHFTQLTPREVKVYLKEKGFNVRI